MDPDVLLESGSYVLVFLTLLGAGVGLPIPEDLVLLASGVLVHRGVLRLAPAIAVCLSGVFLGDLALFLLARRLGDAALRRPFLARILPPERRERLDRLFRRHGGKVVFVARHVAGLRVPVFALAGVHGMAIRRFLLWDLLGLAVSGPLMMGLGYLFSDRLDLLRRGLSRVEHWGLLALVAALAAYACRVAWRRSVLRRGVGARSGS